MFVSSPEGTNRATITQVRDVDPELLLFDC